MRYLFLVLSVVLLSSCSYSHWREIELIIPETHPFEDAFSETLWFTLEYFDGERIEERHVPKGMRRIRVRVRAGCLSVFAFRPLGELGAVGGFFEPGDDSVVYILPEHGAFSEMLLRAAAYRPEPVARLSMNAVLANVEDLQAVDESAFLADVFNGTLGYGIPMNERKTVHFDSIPRGIWISERYDIPSFQVGFSGDHVNLMVYPGVYRYAEADLGMLLTVIVEDDGEASMMITSIPVW